MKKLKAGIIGTGMGRLHMDGYSKGRRVEIFAICDINRKEAEEFAKKYKARHVFTDYEKMLDIYDHLKKRERHIYHYCSVLELQLGSAESEKTGQSP